MAEQQEEVPTPEVPEEKVPVSPDVDDAKPEAEPDDDALGDSKLSVVTSSAEKKERHGLSAAEKRRMKKDKEREAKGLPPVDHEAER